MSSVPAPLLIVTVKVYEPSTPAGVPEVPAVAAVKVPATTTNVVPAVPVRASTNSCAFVNAAVPSPAST